MHSAAANDEPTPQRCDAQLRDTMHPAVTSQHAVTLPRPSGEFSQQPNQNATIITIASLSTIQLQSLLLHRGVPPALCSVLQQRRVDGSHFAKETFIQDAIPFEARTDENRIHIARLSRLHRDLMKNQTVHRDEIQAAEHGFFLDHSGPQPNIAQPETVDGTAGENEGKGQSTTVLQFVDHDHGSGEFSIIHGADFSSAVCGLVVHKLAGHEGEVSSVCVSRDGLTVVSGSADETARAWDATTAAERHRYTGHTGALTAVAMNARTSLVTASWDKTVRVWDTLGHHNQNTPTAVIQGHTNSVASVCFSPSGDTLATGGADDVIKLWNMNTGRQPEEVAILKGHRGTVLSLGFSNDGARIISSGEDFTVKIWDVESRKCLTTLEGHTFAVTSCSFLSGDEKAISGSCDETAKIWNIATRQVIFNLEGHNGSVTAVCATPDGQTVATGSEDCSIRLWSALSGLLMASLVGHQLAVNSLCFTSDGCRLVSASSDCTARVWYLETRRTLAQYRSESGDRSQSLRPCKAIFFSPDQQFMLSVTVAEKRFSTALWSVASGSSTGVLQRSSAPPCAVAFSGDGTFAAIAIEDGTISAWSCATGELLFTVKSGHARRICSLSFAENTTGRLSQVVLRSRDSQLAEQYWTSEGAAANVTKSKNDGSYLLLLSGSSS